MFDPYHKWLGIPKDQRPPTIYQLLGISPGETDRDVIEEAALRQTAHVRTYQIGPRGAECTKLLNEISQARTILLNPAKRQEYDTRLGTTLGAGKAGDSPAGPDPFSELAEDRLAPVSAPARLPSGVFRKPRQIGLILGLLAGGAALTGIVLFLVLPRGGAPTKETLVQNQDKKKDDRANAIESRDLAADKKTKPLIKDDSRVIDKNSPKSPDKNDDKKPGADGFPKPNEGKVPIVVKDQALFPFHRVYYQGKNGPISSVALDHQGQTAAWADDSGVALKNLQSGNIVKHLGKETAGAVNLVFAPNGKMIAVACRDHKVRIWEMPQIDKPRELNLQQPITALAFSADSSVIIAGGHPAVKSWESKTGNLRNQFQGHRDHIFSVGISNDNGRVYSFCRQLRMVRWYLDPGKPEEHYWPNHSFGYAAIGWGNQGGKALAISNELPLTLWDLGQDKEIRTYSSLKKEVIGLGWSPLGEFALVKYCDGWQVFETDSGKDRGQYAGHQGEVTDVAIGPGGVVALSGDKDGVVLLWSDKMNRYP